jgi:hypothetical protein
MIKSCRVIVACCAVLAGCSSPVGVEPELELRTARTEYMPGAAIQVHVDNDMDEDVYVAHCNQRVTMMLQRRVRDAWENYRQTNAPCLAIYPMGELLIASGTQLTETLQIDEAGDYRLQLHARLAHEDFGSTIVVSGSFRVRYPPD